MRVSRELTPMGAQQNPQGEHGVWRQLLPVLHLSYWSPGAAVGWD